MNERIVVNAIECTQNNKKFYLTVLSSKILKKSCFISRREENSEEGFQRHLDSNRAKAIQKYMDDDKGSLPSNLILSAQKNAELNFDNKKMMLTFTANDKSFMVLDGQHRLYGLNMSENEYFISVAIFVNLEIKDEVGLFIDINTNQKGVSSTLLLDIKGLAGKDTTVEQKQRELFKQLDENSPLSGKLLSSTGNRVGYISRAVFNEATKDLFENGFFAEQELDIVYNGVKNYLEASDLVLNLSKNEKAKLTTANIFKALFSVFNDCVDKSFQIYGDLKVEHLQEVLRPISTIRFENIGSNKESLKKLIYEMKKNINGYSSKYKDVDGNNIF